MKQRTKIIFGVAILIAIVSMNIRHAWMNYGIYRHVEAGTPSANHVRCDTKKDYELFVNLEQLSMDIYVSCKVELTKEYYKTYEDGYERLIATETYNYRTNTRTITPMDAKLEDEYRTVSTPIYDLIPSTEYYCGNHKDNECCYAKAAEMDCSKLLKQTY